MTGSRDPIREYLRERRRQERLALVSRIAGWFLMAASAVIVVIVTWAAFVWVAATFNS